MIAWFTRNGVAANLLAFIVAAGGFFVTAGIKMELFPEFSLDRVIVAVPYPGAAPEDVEEGICIRIEEQIQDLQGIRKITSTAEEGIGTVVVEVQRGYSPDTLLDRIKNRIDAIDTFPEESEQPIIELAEIERDTITIAVWGDLDEWVLRSLAERVRDDITLLPGVSSAEVTGVRNYEISIAVSEDKLREYGLTFAGFADILRRDSIDLPGGRIRAAQGEILLRSNTLARDQQALEQIVVLADESGSLVRVKDIAEVSDAFTTDPLITRFNGQPAAMVRVFEVGDQNPLDISRTIRQYVKEQKLLLPEGVEIDVWRDFSIYLRDRLNLLITNGVIGFLLVLTVLALFLRPMLALFVCIGIPLSFLGTLFIMPVFGLTINLVTLFGFILVLGIVVDDAIVVGESVFTEFQKDGPSVASSVYGTQLVAIPVTFAVLTTVVAFIPIFFVPGTFGKLFFGIPAVVIPTLLWSLVFCKLVLPYHLTLCKVGQKSRSEMGALSQVQRRVADWLERFVQKRYKPFLEIALRWRYLTLSAFLATLLLIGGLLSGGLVRVIFLSPVPSDYIVALMTLPDGYPYEQTEKNINKMVEALDDVLLDLEAMGMRNPVLYRSLTIGGSQFQGGGPGGSRDSTNLLNQGEVALELVPPEERDISAPDLAQKWRDRLGQLPAVRDLIYQAEAANPAGAAINIQLTGSSYEIMEIASRKIQRALESYRGIFDIRDTYDRAAAEINVLLLPEARTTGLTQFDLASQVRGAFFGDEVQRIQRGRNEIRVMVRYPEAERVSLSSLEGMWIRNRDGVAIPIQTVANLDLGEGYSKITRVDRRRSIQVLADADDNVANVEDILNEIRAGVLRELESQYPDLNITFEGESREQSEIRASMARGAVLAALVIYALIAIPFRSYLQPLIIMSVIPFGLVGAVVGHWITGQDFSILSLLGLVALSGVVVNDSLVLVDFINKEVRSGKPLLPAVRESGAVRFRPVLLTSLTTFVGLIPILLETNLQAQFLIPMATSLAFGILFATFMTLLLVPSLYMILEDLRSLVSKRGRAETAGD